MFVARLIKTGTPLHQKIGERMRFLDYLFIMRPTLFFPVWIMALAGASAANSIKIEELYWSGSIDWLGFLLFVGLTLVSGATFIRNQITEQEAFRINHKVSLVGESLSSEQAAVMMRGLLVSGFALVSSVGILGSVFAGGAKWSVILWVGLLYLIWGILCNGEKFKWSSRPVLGVLANGLAGFSCFMMGWSYGNEKVVAGAIYSIPYVLGFIAVVMVAAIPDRMGDRQINKKTFAVQFGVRTTILFASILVSVSTLLGYQFGDPVISTASIISLPFFIVALILAKMQHVLRAIRYPILILGLFVSMRYPWFLVPSIAIFYLAKYYFYFRFELDYPTFQVLRD